MATVIHLNSDSTDGNTTFTDSSTNAHSVTAFGDAQHSTAVPYLGATSISFDGTGDYIQVDNRSVTNFLHNGSETYEVSGYWYFNSISGSIIPFASSGGYSKTYGLNIYYATGSNELRALIPKGTQYSIGRDARGTWSPEINRWYYICVKYIGNKLKLYVDGALIGESTESHDLTTTANSDTQFKVGAMYDSANTSSRNSWYYHNGYIQDFKIVTDIATTQVSISEPGTGYVGDGQDVEPTGGTGTGLKIDYVVTGEEITSVEITDEGTDYTDGDEVEIPGGTTNAKLILEINQEVPLTTAPTLMSQQRFGAFAVTTSDSYTTIPFHKASSFRLNNYTGKIVGVRRRHKRIIVENFDDLDVSDWTGTVETGHSVHRIEGEYGGSFKDSAYKTLTSEAMLDGSEVELTFRTPNIDLSYSMKFEIWDDPARIGAGSPASAYTGESSYLNKDSVYRVIFRLRPSLSKYDVFLEREGVRETVTLDADGDFGSNQMSGSIIAIEGSEAFDVDPIIYQQKVNTSHEQIFSTSSFSYPCDDNISEYEIINLGSDAMNYSDNTDNISLSGFYAE